MVSIKKLIKYILPYFIFRKVEIARTRIRGLKFRGRTTQEVFSEIYQNGLWGDSIDPAQPFYSGSGSHDNSVTDVYVDGIRNLLESFPVKLNAVDLGCGDFSIGGRLRPLFSGYTACDIVPQLIEFNKNKYQSLGVDFRVINLITDELPKGDIVFIRQVLQHLSNEQIEQLIPKLEPTYDILVLTEHLPKSGSFVPNIDKPAGPDIRLGYDSGVVLTRPPFNLRAIEERVICEVDEGSGVIRTTMYKLK